MSHHPTHITVYPLHADATKMRHLDRPQLKSEGVEWPNDGYTASALTRHAYATTDPALAHIEPVKS